MLRLKGVTPNGCNWESDYFCVEVAGLLLEVVVVVFKPQTINSSCFQTANNRFYLNKEHAYSLRQFQEPVAVALAVH